VYKKYIAVLIVFRIFLVMLPTVVAIVLGGGGGGSLLVPRRRRRRPGRMENGAVHVEQSHSRREVEEAGAHQHQNTRHWSRFTATQSLLAAIQ